MEKLTKFNVGYLLVALLAIVLMRDAWVNASQVELIPYSEFLHHVKNAEVADITISKNVIEGKLVKPTTDGRTRIVTTRVEPLLAKELSQYDVKFAGVIENTFFRDLLSWVLPALVFFGIWMVLARRMGAGGMGGGLGGALMSIGKSNAKVYVETRNRRAGRDAKAGDRSNEHDMTALAVPTLYLAPTAIMGLTLTSWEGLDLFHQLPIGALT